MTILLMVTLMYLFVEMSIWVNTDEHIALGDDGVISDGNTAALRENQHLTPVDMDEPRWWQPGGSCSVRQKPIHAAVDLRIIILTFNRAHSVMRLLASINDAFLENDTVLIEIWIDRMQNGSFSKEIVDFASKFNFTQGVCSIIVQPTHVGITGQWLQVRMHYCFDLVLLKQLTSRCKNLTVNTGQVMFSGEIYYY